MLRHLFVADRAVQVAVLAEHRACHGGTQGRVDLAHQHGGLAEGFLHPLLEYTAGTVGPVPYPQPIGEGCTIIAGAEECTVRGGGQSGFDFFACGVEVVARLVVLIVNLSESDEELVVVRDVLGGGAGRCAQQERYAEREIENEESDGAHSSSYSSYLICQSVHHCSLFVCVVSVFTESACSRLA